jgi:hypothetical protein
MVMTWTDVRRANIQNNKDQLKKRAERRMTLTVILLSLSDVRLDETRRTSLASLNKAASLSDAAMLSDVNIAY